MENRTFSLRCQWTGFQIVALPSIIYETARDDDGLPAYGLFYHVPFLTT